MIINLAKMEPQRSVRFNNKVQNIGQENIDRIIKWYQKGTPLQQIVRMINGMNHSDGISLSIIDCYAVLYQAKREDKVKQRQKHLETELEIDNFRIVYKAWTRKARMKDVFSLLPGMRIPIERAYKSFNNRQRDEKRQAEELLEEKAINVLKFATNQLIDNRQALVIYLDDLPEELRRKDLSTQVETDVHFDSEDELKSSNLKQMEEEHAKKSPLGGFSPVMKTVDSGRRAAENVLSKNKTQDSDTVDIKESEEDLLKRIEQEEQQPINEPVELQNRTLDPGSKKKALDDILG